VTQAHAVVDARACSRLSLVDVINRVSRLSGRDV